MSKYSFADRHIGSNASDTQAMLQTIGVATVEELIDKTIPAAIRLSQDVILPPAMDEKEYMQYIRELANKNKIYKNYIGLGYYGTITPGVILRNIFENPAWYTAYTPYQAEIAQGRMEALLNYQTMVCDLTAMPLANASLLDEATAAAEAMTMFFHSRSKAKQGATKFFVADSCFPQTIDVIYTRAQPLGIEVVVGNPMEAKIDEQFFGVLLQYPCADGAINNYEPLVTAWKQNEIYVVVAADLLSLTLLKPPGEWGADCVVGNTQRFGVPLGNGGPHAAFFACKEDFKRDIPGRLIGVSIDAAGNRALRMALQTREQHIKRDKATSNICTAQVLLAVMASMYSVYHGPDGLKHIATQIHSLASLFANTITPLGYHVQSENYFDTLKIRVRYTREAILNETTKAGYNLRWDADEFVYVSFDETAGIEDVRKLVEIFSAANKSKIDVSKITLEHTVQIDSKLQRTSSYMQQDVFNRHHMEHEMLRYIKHLELKDLSLVHSMIALGSCTMKLNATTQMAPLSWAAFSSIHPFAPANQVEGYLEMIKNLESYLSKITGFAATSLQPNSGAQGEYAGLLVINAYLQSKGQGHRNIALIPQSAHGTNPASAVMCGMKIVVVKCDDKGNIDIADLRTKAEQHAHDLACLMVTYPSTHGVYEEGIKEITKIIHDNGGQVYMDGANMNAQVGLTNPGMIGADVCHLNLHKTFAIPHGGGGPGMGPICVAEHLMSFLPGHPLVKTGGSKAVKAVSAAPFGSASILHISYAYIRMLGADGLKKSTQHAILNANYIKARLEKHYPILYKGTNGFCAHEMILDCRAFKNSAGIEVTDIAKRLIDYGFHAPTVSFPVAGTLMIEPTESEPKAELDRFCDAMIAIRKEIEMIENATWSKEDNPLINSPHTAAEVTATAWAHSYSREEAAYPLPYVRHSKFWPSVKRVDNAYGDRNLVCTCLPVEEYMN